MLNGVTLTGADDNTDPSELLKLSEKYPFVEWGILLGSNQGVSRFPCPGWFEVLCAYLRSNSGPTPKLSLHLCGQALKDLLVDGCVWSKAVMEVLPYFRRVQLNFGGRKLTGQEVKSVAYAFAYGRLVRQIPIIQTPSFGSWLAQYLYRDEQEVHELFDQSGGRGNQPESWPETGCLWRCGYAGGLAPWNLKEHLPRMEEASGGTDYWIDMEKSLRGDKDEFDIGRCEQVLMLCDEIIRPKKRAKASPARDLPAESSLKALYEERAERDPDHEREPEPEELKSARSALADVAIQEVLKDIDANTIRVSELVSKLVKPEPWSPPDFIPEGAWIFRDGYADDSWYVSRVEPGVRDYPTDHYVFPGTSSNSPRIMLSHLAALHGVRFGNVKLPPENKVQVKHPAKAVVTTPGLVRNVPNWEPDRLKADEIINAVDDLLNAGKFAECDEIFCDLDPKALSELQIVTYLGITLAARKELRHRTQFFWRAIRVISDRSGMERAHKLLGKYLNPVS